MKDLAIYFLLVFFIFGNSRSPTTRNKDNYYYVNIRTFKDDIYRPLYKGYWPHDDDVRRIIFIFDDLKNKRVRFMGVPDKKPKPTGDSL